MAQDILNPLGFLHRGFVSAGRTGVAVPAVVKSASPANTVFTFSGAFRCIVRGQTLSFSTIDCYTVDPAIQAMVQTAATSVGVTMTPA